MGWIGTRECERIQALLTKAGLPTARPGVDPDACSSACGRQGSRPQGREADPHRAARRAIISPAGRLIGGVFVAGMNLPGPR
jgi:hypothetical protein